MRFTIVFLIVIFAVSAHAQQVDIQHLQPDSATFENIYSKKIYSDSLTSTFVIWIKYAVPKHKHAWHTEQVFVLEGHAKMLLGDSTIEVSPGQQIFIPKGTPHAVIVNEGEILKVVSIQAPIFDGSDRIKLE